MSAPWTLEGQTVLSMEEEDSDTEGDTTCVFEISGGLSVTDLHVIL